MKRRLVVLLLRIAGAPDLPTKDYAERLFTSKGKGTRNLVDYYYEMSHGHLDLGDSRVFDWIDYGHTTEEADALWTTAYNEKLSELLAARGETS